MRATSISRRLREVVDAAGDETFVVDAAERGGPWSYTAVDDLVDRTAAALARLGVGPGSAVHVRLANSIDFVACLFAVNRLGGVVVPTSPASTADDVAYITSHAECAVSIVDAAGVEVVLAARDMAPEIGHVVSVGAPGPVDGVRGLDELRTDVAGGVGDHRGNDDDLAAVLYTSGTTGWPKGVMLSNRNLLFSGEAVAAHLRVRPDDRWLVTLPLFHLNALGYSLMSALSSRASVALLDHFEPSSWDAAVDATGATLSSLFAVHARGLLSVATSPRAEPSTLRLFLFAQHLTSAERQLIEQRFDAPAVQVYGLTETIAPTIADVPYGPRDADLLGRAALWATVKLVDRAGREVPPGTGGELVVQGEPGRTLMSGYYRRPEETALVLRDGWLRTGDRMLQEPDGSFRFLGRAVELIKPGVDNVSAPEIERVLYEHVSVLDASVVGVPNAAGDEEIVAFVVLQPGDDATPDELLVWAAERLADYKVPKRLVLIDELPRNPLGKVLKRELQRLLGLEGRGE